MHLDHVAGGAGLLRDDGHVSAGERIEQARLAGVDRAGDDHAEAVAQTLAAAVGEMRGDGGDEMGDDGVGLDRDVRRDVALVGEVEPGLGQRLRAQQLFAPALIERAGRALRLAPAPDAPAPRSRH